MQKNNEINHITGHTATVNQSETGCVRKYTLSTTTTTMTTNVIYYSGSMKDGKAT